MVFVTKILSDQVLSKQFSPVDLNSYGFVLFFLKRWARCLFLVPLIISLLLLKTLKWCTFVKLDAL